MTPLYMMTAQDVFSAVLAHARQQKEKSIEPNTYFHSKCRYRLNHLKCFAGVLISDDTYSEEFENNYSWSRLVRLKKVASNNSELIQLLQTIHDEYEVDEWEKELWEVSQAYNLTFA